MTRLLITDDDISICKTLQMHYTRQGFDVLTANTADEGYRKFLAQKVDAIITDVHMPVEDGFNLLSRVRHKSSVPVIMITAFHDLDTTVNAVHGGATDFVPKPIDLRELDDVVHRAVEQRQAKLNPGLVFPSNTPGPFGMITGTSKAIKKAFHKIALVSQNKIPVLLIGEPGTGKEVAATAIHKSSTNKDHPFVVVNCASANEAVLERDIFGYVDEAKLASHDYHKGSIELVGNGTLFLDEVSELSLKNQARLMHVLDSHKNTPIGSTLLKPVNARIIASTNKDLSQLLDQGRFREDLFYRLNVMPINLPPLRDRKEDIGPLVEYFIRRINSELRKSLRNVTSEVVDCLKLHDWPGNICELEQVMMKAAVQQTGAVFTISHFPEHIVQKYKDLHLQDDQKASVICADLPDNISALPSLREVERQYVDKILERTDWHKGKACDILSISRPKLERHIKNFNLKKKLGVS